jgi:putative hydrolase of the HAD superfamily
MAGQGTPRALLLDCLGTLVRLEPPAPRLAAALGVPEADAARAMRREIAFYRAHMHEAVDLRALARLRERCARVVADELGLREVPVGALLDALRFTPFEDTVPALRALRGAGLRLVVVSNWDVSLHEVLTRTGLDRLVDGAVASAEVGAAKPDPAPVRAGLELAGAVPVEAWLVGDTPEADVDGARAAGVRPVLVDRDGARPVPGVTVIGSLVDLPGLVA